MMGDNYIRLENYEMLKALYDFKATFAKTLSFHENEHFILYQTNTKQRNWWQVVNSLGQLGYIPSNYVTTVKVEPQFLIDYLRKCIEKLQEVQQQGSSGQADKQDLLLRLVEKERQAELGRKVKKQAPMPPVFSTSTLGRDTTNQTVYSNPDGDARSAPSNTSYATAQSTLHYDADPAEAQLIAQCRRMTVNDQRRQLPRQSISDTIHTSQSEPIQMKRSPSQSALNTVGNSSPIKSSSSTSCEINSKAAYQLLDQVRRNTQLSHEMSKVAVAVVVSGLQELLPASISHYFAAVLNQLQVPLIASKMSIEETHDANRLKVIFTELTSCKEDSQQRSWMLYEDEPVIVEYIKELTSILTNADANVSRHALRSDQYNGVTTLIQYYQMEPRWTIRQLLLQSFGVMCSLDAVVLTIMLNSVLPMELASDMRTYPRNVPRLNYSSLLLTMIFSMGEPMPVTHLGVKKRRQYLELCRRVLRTESYNEHRHRCEDVLKCFTRIFCEELPESKSDQKLVREISNEFPHLFKM
ncbi:NCK-interacting protein with SH3 domain isoform X2 [Diprion similis]|uniref:NCK-interacting protein with SH3 domain isoform X2 n=1 Tax=Diprion similis TaxID=362088 RepID=UPI001EF8125E|nr:NCK-interacting protein with SH3 domain isoform X2 [Diprion similis]